MAGVDPAETVLTFQEKEKLYLNVVEKLFRTGRSCRYALARGYGEDGAAVQSQASSDGGCFARIAAVSNERMNKPAEADAFVFGIDGPEPLITAFGGRLMAESCWSHIVESPSAAAST